MFVGHYAAAFALKGKETSSSLGALFLATQFVDILFFPFVMAGIESLKFEAGFTEVNSFNMDHYPFTHGLLASVLWAGLFGALYYWGLAKSKVNKKQIAIVMALGVLSHWFADLIVHTPDLPLISGEPKMGFGMWHNKALTFGTEAVLLVLSLWYYLRRTRALNTFGKYAAIGFVGFLILVNYLNLYVLPQNEDILALTVSALAAYSLFAGIAYWVDRKRGAYSNDQ